MSFSDHFSDYAERYEAYRPSYPGELFAYLASLAPGHDLACDCATGNGQAALGLAQHFNSVVAVDASREQLAQAPPHERIIYVRAFADRTPIPYGSVDLVTVATAFHWLDSARFFAEVQRIARPDGILAVWGYKLPIVSAEVDAAVHRFSAKVLRQFWLPETKLAAEGYQTIPFPFDEIATPPFRMAHEWNLHQLTGFMGTWSASLRYRIQTGRDPIDVVREEFEAAWGNPQQERQVSWDLHPRIGRIRGG